MKTAETLMVRPLNVENLKNYLSKFYGTDENKKLIISDDAIITVRDIAIITDNECCYGFVDEKYSDYSEKVEFVLDIGIRFEKKTENGWSIPMSYESYHPLSLSELEENNLLDKECSLKEFTGSRFEYNPRIMSNTSLLLENINDTLKN